MLSPSCPNCQIQLATNQIGVLTVEMSEQGPLAVYSTDELKCPDCNILQLNISNVALPFYNDELIRFLTKSREEHKQIHYVWLNKKERDNYKANNKFKFDSIPNGPYEEIKILNYKNDCLREDLYNEFNRDC